jgi:glycosyltransferase involved in cell wall biosynthesis
MINLFLMDIKNAQNTNGVDRYLETLLLGLQSRLNIRIHWIQLLNDNQKLFNTEEQFPYYIKYTIPMPQQLNEIIGNHFWMQKYNEHIFKLIYHLFDEKQNCIIHIQTLNLIHLALSIKELIDCKIITHLHCIPWKSLYNINIKKFNQLYSKYYLNSSFPTFVEDEFSTNISELQSYNDADHVICLTRCAQEFLSYRMKKYNGYVSIIPNGINDFHNEVRIFKKEKKTTENFRCIYVGVVSESKGLKYILKALKIVTHKGYRVSLDIAGIFPSGLNILLKDEYPELDLNFLGCIPFEKLKHLYTTCDIGLIASLQEQASLVAIEMAMFGLPIVTTAVDGLDEMFTNGVNALKVNTNFSKVFGLSVDVDMMSNKIINLIENQDLRRQLETNVRKLYETELNLDLMIDRTLEVYKKVLKS